ncbi:unnamed protein product [Acanthosepion pharaonis]|uniref:Uncharacterized protein n=1 Tax=Acanthosepion pharaonis TaxID=158019 RepID=A0A812CU63_ACAPH|nr:unnamed protein product [Sepia pharaonis]
MSFLLHTVYRTNPIFILSIYQSIFRPSFSIYFHSIYYPFHLLFSIYPSIASNFFPYIVSFGNLIFRPYRLILFCNWYPSIYLSIYLFSDHLNLNLFSDRLFFFLFSKPSQALSIYFQTISRLSILILFLSIYLSILFQTFYFNPFFSDRLIESIYFLSVSRPSLFSILFLIQLSIVSIDILSIFQTIFPQSIFQILPLSFYPY